MAHGQVTTNVPAELKSAAVNGVVTSAEGVFDYNENKTQETINQDLKNAIEDIDVTEQISGKADKSEMSVVPGTGVNADKTTITLKNGTSATVLTQHQDISSKANVSDVYTKTQVDASLGDKQDALADSEDVVKVIKDNNVALNFANKTYNGATFSGLGRTYLHKNIVTLEGVEKNVLTQEMVNTTNTIYHIQYDYDLNGETITIPARCVLKFDGGVIKNGTLNGAISIDKKDNSVSFDNVTFGGTIVSNINISWFKLTSTHSLSNTQQISSISKAVVRPELINWDVDEINVMLDNNNYIALKPGINDFNNTKFKVSSDKNNYPLFKYIGLLNSYTVEEGDTIDTIVSDSEFSSKTVLVVSDNTPLTHRSGYTYDAYRKDILFVENNKILNQPIIGYTDEYTELVINYFHVDYAAFYVKNACVIRDTNMTASNTYTPVFSVDNAYNVIFENVTVDTYNVNDLYDDAIFTCYNIYNLYFNNISLNGTYSLVNHSGYGFYLNGITNLICNNLQCSANWGIFGTNNVNNVSIKNSNINRFDCHCYSKDIFFENISFNNLYNQFGCHFGYVYFMNCNFNNFIPYLNNGDYNSSPCQNIVFQCCSFCDVENLVKINGIGTSEITRDFLTKLYIPEICIRDSKFNNKTIAQNGICQIYNESWENTIIMNIDGLEFDKPIQLVNNKYYFRVKIFANNLIQKNLINEDNTYNNTDIIKQTYAYPSSVIEIHNSTINTDGLLNNAGCVFYNSEIYGSFDKVHRYMNCNLHKKANNVGNIILANGHYINCGVVKENDNDVFVFNNNNYCVIESMKDSIYSTVYADSRFFGHLLNYGKCYVKGETILSFNQVGYIVQTIYDNYISTALSSNFLNIKCKWTITVGANIKYFIGKKEVTENMYLYGYYIGDSSSRPTLTASNKGNQYFDETLGKFICWNGTSWVNLDGTALS